MKLFLFAEEFIRFCFSTGRVVDCRQPCHLHLLVDLFGDSHTHKKGEDKQKPKESYSCILWTWGLTPGVGPPINNYVLSVYRRGLVRASLLNTSRRGVVNSAVPFHASPTSYTHLCCILFGCTFLIWFISPINLPSYIPSPFIWINKTYLFSAFCSVSMCRPMLLMLFQFSRQFSTWMNFDVILGIPPSLLLLVCPCRAVIRLLFLYVKAHKTPPH